jgi:hypothetical protein
MPKLNRVACGIGRSIGFAPLRSLSTYHATAPDGIVIAEIINWTGQIIRFPRELLSEFLARQESNRTGVYLLIGDDQEVPGRRRVYVGETDNLGARLRQHATADDKEFWNHACVVTSKDQNLTKAHALFLQAKVIERATLADRVTLENAQKSLYENVPESDASDMSYFFEQISCCSSSAWDRAVFYVCFAAGRGAPTTYC